MKAIQFKVVPAENGTIVAIDTEEGSKVSVFEKGNELEVIRLLCTAFEWKDVINFEEGEPSEHQMTDLPI